MLLAARLKVAGDTEREAEQSFEDQRKYEERQRLLAQRVRELEAREAANNLRVCYINGIITPDHLFLQEFYTSSKSCPLLSDVERFRQQNG